MSEYDEGKQAFVELVKGIDAAVEVVIPTIPSNSMFLISLTKSGNRKFLTVPEDDLLDLPSESDIREKVTKDVRGAIGEL
ncbi:MAG: hypothetical protein ACREI3_02090 [Nitrospirales bacterium]